MMKATILSLMFAGCFVSLGSTAAFAATNKARTGGREVQTDLSRSTKNAEYCVNGEAKLVANASKHLESDEKLLGCSKHFNGLPADETNAGGKNFERSPQN